MYLCGGAISVGGHAKILIKPLQEYNHRALAKKLLKAILVYQRTHTVNTRTKSVILKKHVLSYGNVE
jgi:hypothetical protein